MDDSARAAFPDIADGDSALDFRIGILNFALYVAAMLSLLFALMHEFGLNEIGRFHSLVNYGYSLVCAAFIVLVRHKRHWVRMIIPAFIVVSLASFTSALINVTIDEFRLIWFYFAIFISFILLDERAGVLVTAICVLIVVLAAATVDLQLSSRALLSGLVGMFAISLLSRTYTRQLTRYEAQLKEKNEVLEQSVRDLDAALAQAWQANRAKDLFLANMSHEIRTPMNGVLGMVQVLRGTGLDHEQKHYLDAIQRAGSNLLVLIDDLLDISRIESGRLEIAERPFSTFDWVMDMQFVTEPLFEDKPKLLYSTEVSDALPPNLVGDAARLTQIASNLVSNAAKFTDSGEVVLRIDGQPDGPERFALCVEVEDSGSGIPRDELERIFQPFEQACPERIASKGVGLGLAISRRLAQTMGGELSVESRADEGSVFRLTLSLPLAGMSDAAIEETPDTATLNPLQVLLVDDDALNRLTVSTLLAQRGHQVAEAQNGVEAVEMLRQGDYDVVVMDVHMPVLDGVAATRQIREASEADLAEVPIIGLTASVMEDERRHYLEVGMDAVVQKPVILERLLDTIYRALAARQRSSRQPE